MDLKEIMYETWASSMWLRVGFCEHGNEMSRYIKGAEFLVS
jgi:hypothetical protein